MTTCFQCGFVYKNWNSDADPIIIHSTHQPDCDFLSYLREKGLLSCENIITKTDTVSLFNGKKLKRLTRDCESLIEFTSDEIIKFDLFRKASPKCCKSGMFPLDRCILKLTCNHAARTFLTLVHLVYIGFEYIFVAY